jgi:hypothetical protein
MVAFIIMEAKLKNGPINLASFGQHLLINVNGRWMESKAGMQNFGIHPSETIICNLHHKGDAMTKSSDIYHREKREQIKSERLKRMGDL